MYTIVREAVAWIDVDWTGLETGGPDEASVEVARSIRMKVLLLPRSELLKILPPALGGTAVEGKDVAELALEVARDWAGVVDEDKRPLAFSAELLEQILEHEHGFASGFEISYLKACGGRGKVREKNSDRSPEDGRAEEPGAGTKRRRSPSS